MKALLFAVALWSAVLPAFAAYQVRFLKVRVTPYYESAERRYQRPRVATSSGFDRQLASDVAQDVAAVAEALRADPGGANPVTMMVLAVRLYDVGLRDESAFWFNAARGRMATASAVLDMNVAENAALEASMRSFGLQAGAAINGYSTCNLENHVRIRREALQWVEKNAWTPLFVESMQARPGDRRAHLAQSLAALRAEVEEEAATLSRPGEADRMAALRRESGAETKYCWK